MDPDPEAEHAACKIVKTTFISLVFITCHNCQTETTTTVATIQHTFPDSAVKKQVGLSTPKKNKKKTIYLSFDDGPNKGSRNVMHIADQEQVPISMFIIGEHVYGSVEQTSTYDSLKNCAIIELENHSFTHAKNRFEKFYSLPDSVVKDFRRCADSLGLTNNIVRTPGRNIWGTTCIASTDIKNSLAAADSLQKAGYIVIGWDLEWHYNKHLELTHTCDEMLNQLDSMFSQKKTKTDGHLVLLAHDQVYSDMADSSTLHQFFKKLKTTTGYDFDVISNYPGIKN